MVAQEESAEFMRRIIRRPLWASCGPVVTRNRRIPADVSGSREPPETLEKPC